MKHAPSTNDQQEGEVPGEMHEHARIFDHRLATLVNASYRLRSYSRLLNAHAVSASLLSTREASIRTNCDYLSLPQITNGVVHPEVIRSVQLQSSPRHDQLLGTRLSGKTNYQIYEAVRESDGALATLSYSILLYADTDKTEHIIITNRATS
jgi:hypothetical protein